jgi:hypothetical protein
MPHADGQLIGKYRRLLLPADELPIEAEFLRPRLQALFVLHEQRSISDALYATLFVLLYAFERALGREWSKRRRYGYWAEMLNGVLVGAIPAETAVATKLRKLPLFGMPGFVFATLADWLERSIDLQLTHAPVSATAMLAAQASGTRFVTVAFSEAITGALIDDKRDAFEFCLHDIGHAYTFFRAEHDPAGQVRFFAQLMSDLPRLESLALADRSFAAALEYCMSDMNSHPEHLRQYLRGVIIEAYRRSQKGESARCYSEDALREFLAGLGACQPFAWS